MQLLFCLLGNHTAAGRIGRGFFVNGLDLVVVLACLRMEALLETFILGSFRKARFRTGCGNGLIDYLCVFFGFCISAFCLSAGRADSFFGAALRTVGKGDTDPIPKGMRTFLPQCILNIIIGQILLVRVKFHCFRGIGGTCKEWQRKCTTADHKDQTDIFPQGCRR